MHIVWGVAITASVAQAVIVGLLIRNYVGIGFTRLEEVLIALSGILLTEGVFIVLNLLHVDEK